MAGEQDINKRGDRIQFERAGQTGDTARQDSDLGRKNHQQLHEDFKRTENKNTLSDPALVTPFPGESPEAYKRRVEEIQLNRFGFEGELAPEDMGGKTISTKIKQDDTTVYEQRAKQAIEAIPHPSPILDETPYDSPVTLNVQVTNVPEVPEPVAVEELGQYHAMVLEAGAKAVRPVEKWLTTPNAVNDALSEIGSAVETAAAYYANATTERVIRDSQMVLDTLGEAVVERINHPMTPEERAQTTGMLLPLFFFDGNVKEPIDPRTAHQMGLESMNAAELRVLGIESRPIRMQLERDEFSIQARIPGDDRAWFRAEVPEPGVICATDLYIGDLPEGMGNIFFAEAMQAHGAFPTRHLILSGIRNAESVAQFKAGVAAHETLVGRCAAKALKRLGITPTAYRYEIKGNHLNIVIDTQR